MEWKNFLLYFSYVSSVIICKMTQMNMKKLMWICVVTVEGGVYLISTYQVSNIVQGKNLLCFSGLQCY